MQTKPKQSKDTKIRCLVQADGSRKASNKGEKTEDGDEKKLEAVTVKAEGEFLGNDVATDRGGIGGRFGGSGQEGGQGGSLLALKNSQTIIVGEHLVLCKAGLRSFLVVEVRNRGVVDSRVEEDGLDWFVATSVNLSETEILGASSERGVSLALWRGGLPITGEH